jgi:hypothetical protein
VDDADNPLDLTGRYCEAWLRRASGVPLVSGGWVGPFDCIVLSEAEGLIYYPLEEDTTLLHPGTFDLAVRIYDTATGDLVLSAPTGRSLTVELRDNPSINAVYDEQGNLLLAEDGRVIEGQDHQPIGV